LKAHKSQQNCFQYMQNYYIGKSKEKRYSTNLVRFPRTSNSERLFNPTLSPL
jgi:hypothetical protein